MAELECVDGSVLSVLPVPCVGRDGVPYEVTLRLERDGQEVGAVGERCGFFVAQTAARLRAGDGFPASGLEAGLRAWAQDNDADADEAWQGFARYLPRDREVLCFRARDPDDVSAAGELRVVLRDERTWVHGEGRGPWQLRRLAVVEAWDATGRGVRSVLDRDGLLAFLERLLADCAALGVPYDDVAVPGVRRPVG